MADAARDLVEAFPFVGLAPTPVRMSTSRLPPKISPRRFLLTLLSKEMTGPPSTYVDRPRIENAHTTGGVSIWEL